MSIAVDEAIQVVEYDPQWPEYYRSDATELQTALRSRVRGIEHFGSTSVPGLAAKPIIDILVGPVQWPIASKDRETLESLGYEYLGEAGVPGREYFRRRAAHDTNVAVVEWESPLWNDNVALRDYLRSHPSVARAYASAKKRIWAGGSQTLLSYSTAKDAELSGLLTTARQWAADNMRMQRTRHE
jgi:GrpB-like predicted nucleotidyltransferase (UPF0157 family)